MEFNQTTNVHCIPAGFTLLGFRTAGMYGGQQRAEFELRTAKASGRVSVNVVRYGRYLKAKEVRELVSCGFQSVQGAPTAYYIGQDDFGNGLYSLRGRLRSDN